MNPFSEPQWFVPAFIVIWTLSTGLFALLSGWSGLATAYRANDDVEGERFRFVSGSMGNRFFPVNYSSCLFVTVNERGFELSIFFLFRLLSPPLFIPWSAIAAVEEKRFLFVFRYSAIRLLEQWPIISLRGAAGERIARAYARRPKFTT